MLLIVKGKKARSLCAECRKLHDDDEGAFCKPCEEYLTDAFRWVNDVPDRRRKTVRVMCHYCEAMYTLTPEERQRALDGRDAVAVCHDCRPMRRRAN
jgi:hypothetical protein